MGGGKVGAAGRDSAGASVVELPPPPMTVCSLAKAPVLSFPGGFGGGRTEELWGAGAGAGAGGGKAEAPGGGGGGAA